MVDLARPGRRRLAVVALAAQLAAGCAGRPSPPAAEPDGAAAISFSTLSRQRCPSAEFAVRSSAEWAALTAAHPLPGWPSVDFSREMIIGVRISTGSMPGNVQIGSIDVDEGKLVVRYCECYSPFAAMAFSAGCHVVKLPQQALAPTFERVAYDKSWCDRCWADPVETCD